MAKLAAISATAAFMLALAGCGDGAGDGNEAATAGNAVQNYQAEIEAMPEGQRNAVFIRAIRDADLPQTCQGVESSTYRGETNGAPTWIARCTDGSEWAILITEGGMAQVLTEAQAQAAGITLAKVRPEQQATQ